MTTQATLTSAFTRAAIKFQVAESDYLVLCSQKVDTFEAMAYRMPKSDDLEDFLHANVVPSSGYREDDGSITIFPRQPTQLWREFKASEDAGALRKLWSFSREVCKSELEAMASGDAEKSKTKVSLAAAGAMESSAIAEGMPQPKSDAERPSLYALQRASQALVPPGATFEYVAWECFISAAEEGKLQRAGKMPKVTQELVLSGGDKLAVKDSRAGEAPGQKVSDTDLFRKYMDMRARTFCMIGAARFSTYRNLTDKYLGFINLDVAQGMRGPTLNEVRRFDRALHTEILRWLARSMGSLDSAVNSYLSQEGNPLWKLLDPVVSSLPDQGVEQPETRTSSAAERKRKTAEVSKDESKSSEEGKKEKQLKRCLVCHKRHQPLCQLTPEIRKKLREDKKAKKARSAKAKASSDKKDQK